MPNSSSTLSGTIWSQPKPTQIAAGVGTPRSMIWCSTAAECVNFLRPEYLGRCAHLPGLPGEINCYFFVAAAFGIFKVHDPPKTIVRPSGRAFAEYSS